MKRPICLFPLALVPLLACDGIAGIDHYDQGDIPVWVGVVTDYARPIDSIMPVAGVPVTLDGGSPIMTDSTGAAMFMAISRGSRIVEITPPDTTVFPSFGGRTLRAFYAPPFDTVKFIGYVNR